MFQLASSSSSNDNNNNNNYRLISKTYTHLRFQDFCTTENTASMSDFLLLLLCLQILSSMCEIGDICVRVIEIGNFSIFMISLLTLSRHWRFFSCKIVNILIN